MHNWNTFDVEISHGHTWTHKIHHGLDLKEATTFPHIVLSVIGHGVTPKCHFSWDSQVKSPKIPKIGSLAILKAHNFCKPSIKVRFKLKF